MVGVVEGERRRLVDGHRSSVGSGGRLLAGVHLQGLEVKCRTHSSLSVRCCGHTGGRGVLTKKPPASSCGEAVTTLVAFVLISPVYATGRNWHRSRGRDGCQGFVGPVPSTFLDEYVSWGSSWLERDPSVLIEGCF